MKERPIIFSAPMVRAILEGRKTVTRRVVKPQPVYDRSYADDGLKICGKGKTKGSAASIHCAPLVARFCPYGQPGDRLWVRETFTLESCVDGNPALHNDGRPVKVRPDDDWDGSWSAWIQPHYRATDPAPDLCCEKPNCAQCRDHDMGPHWRPSIFMPRWASRITLEVTGVRVERLQDITPAQILAEGVQIPATPEGHALIDISTKHGPAAFLSKLSGASTGDLLHAHWAALWVKINGPDSWNANPWVWVVEFKRVEAQTA